MKNFNFNKKKLTAVFCVKNLGGFRIWIFPALTFLYDLPLFSTILLQKSLIRSKTYRTEFLRQAFGTRNP